MNWYYGINEQNAVVFEDERARLAVSLAHADDYKFIVGAFKSREDAMDHARNVGYSAREAT